MQLVLHTCRLAVCYLCMYASLCFIVQAIASLLFSWNTSRGRRARPALDYICGNTLKTALTNAPGGCTVAVRWPETLPFECGFTAGDARGLASPLFVCLSSFFLCVTQVWFLPTWMGKVCRSFAGGLRKQLALLCCLPTARMMVLGMVD